MKRSEIIGYLEASLQHFDVMSPFPEDDNYMNNLFKEITIKHLLWKDEVRKETKEELVVRLATDLIK